MDCGYVLVVDDDDTIRESILDILMDQHVPVRGARNGREGLAVLRADDHRACLVLLDLMMPVMNGWEFAQEHAADSSLCAIPICLITAVGPAQSVPGGAVAVLHKPLDLKQLLHIVDQYC